MQVLGPDVNESYLKFTVNKQGNIRFGLAAVKGIGAGIVEALVHERNKNGLFRDIYDMVERISLKTLNKKVVEAMAVSGALDNVSKYQRYQFFSEDDKGQNFIELLLRYGSKVQDENAGSQISLFGGLSEIKPSRPEPRPAEPWSSLQQLNLEKEHVGIYLSAHPLDEYRLVIDHFTNANFADLQELTSLKGKDLKVAGIVTSVEHKITKNGKPFGRMSMEDFSDTHTFTFFSPEYLTFKNYMQPGYAVLLTGKVEPHRFNDGEFDFKVKEMNLLADVGEKMIKSVTLTISLDAISKNLVNEIVGLVQKHKGKTMLKFKVFESVQKISIDLFSRSFRVELNKEFLAYLNNHSEIEFKIE